jgi:hypothetical protein
MGKKSFVSNENCINLFTALTEFRREAKKDFELICKEKKYMKKGVFDREKYFTQLLKEHGIDRNYIGFIKEIVREARYIPRTFSKWNDSIDKPSMYIASCIAEKAVKKLSAYQKACKLKHKQNNEKPQIMEDNILDGHNEITGEVDNLPEESTCADIFSGLSDDDLIDELLRRHPKAKGLHIEYEY